MSTAPLRSDATNCGGVVVQIAVEGKAAGGQSAGPLSCRLFLRHLPMPEQRVTLCYIRKEGKLLLIRKKRGIGAGKINGPGGKVDAGEDPLSAAIRETQEEIGVTPLHAEVRGELRFHFPDGLTLHCLIFLAEDYEGIPSETNEAVPIWYALDQLPYEEMWEDDRAWLPLLLAGKRFRGSVLVEGDQSKQHEISIIDNDSDISI